MKLTLPTVLSFNGGYVDTAGYLALQGLFTAHVTGNFVTLGAALVFGTSGVVAKLLALPVFCMVIIVTRLVSFKLPPRWPVFETMLTLQLFLLLVAAVLAIAIEVEAGGHDAMVFCDGRREMVVPAGGRLEVTRCGTSLKWVRLDSAPFTDRLVRKFRLPVTGWRGQ